MLRYMLDTDTCIYVIKNRPAALRERFDQLVNELSISVITLGELLYGAENSARRSENRRAVEEFAARLDVLPFTTEAAAHYGQIRAALRRQGRPAGVHDMLIGGQARSAGLIVVTNNTREFAHMPGLQVDNWVV